MPYHSTCFESSVASLNKQKTLYITYSQYIKSSDHFNSASFRKLKLYRCPMSITKGKTCATILPYKQHSCLIVIRYNSLFTIIQSLKE